MVILKGYKFRLNTSPTAEVLSRQFGGCNRFVWNRALALQKERLNNKQRCMSYSNLCKLLPAWKKEHTFLAEAPSQTLQQTLKALSNAINEAFTTGSQKRSPVFKKRGHCKDSFRYPQGFEAKNKQVFLPKIGWVVFRKSRHIKGKPKNVTVSREIDHWYISVQTDQKVAEPVHPSDKEVGIDLGIKKLIVLSDGRYTEPLNAFMKAQKKLAKLQRGLSRKVNYRVTGTSWSRRSRNYTGILPT